MSIYDFNVSVASGDLVSLKDYQGKVLLIVNTATHCGFTPQYKGLESLYQKFKNQGFEILDFPCNQFMNQAPENDEEINQICELNYQTTFPRFSKVKVNGKGASPLFQYLKTNSPKELGAGLRTEGGISTFIFGKKIKWNFTKFLINRDGKIIYRFASQVKPEQIESVIADTI